ncbi:lytic transglycosylase domain-containing protein [Buttiauxella sp. S04-F03]|uniref:lytic murein transglycosylase n=1 Tax=Buttiauxella sp. S04-F03 TaxID=2904525 RepID=UPI001E5237D8|nr:lytic murein transglycosylase [Buttiauxella sp. S04-F03]MCE0811356.1 lytic murein transglycosylase [Buttiauxella sp. S04-F03]
MNTPAICLTVITFMLTSFSALSSDKQAQSIVNPSVATQPETTPAPTTLAQQGRNPAEFPAFVETLKEQARLQGISDSTINKAFASIHFVDRVIKSDQSQLEKKIMLDEYLSRVITPQKIEQARAQYQQHRNELEAISNRTGVQSQYIVALWAMESHFGEIQGKEDIVSALATLAFEGRREAFFTKELMAALKILDQGHITVQELKGSWAGAMGQSQFMPSSYLRYGADGDGDGKVDIWTNISDVFASTANYLETEGWKAGGEWGREVTLPEGFDRSLAGTKTDQSKTVSQWQKLGITLKDATTPPAPTRKAWIITPDDNLGRSFLVYNNFRTIMHWNRSYYFAISIGTMADAIAQ